jgi:predicted permease
MLRDIRYAIRGLRRDWALAAVAILTLAAGLGGSAMLFSFVDAWILRPLPFAEGHRLVYGREFHLQRGTTYWASWANYRDLQREARSFDQLAAAAHPGFTLTMDGASERVAGVRMTANFLDTLRTEPVLGRNFRASEEQFGNHRVALVSHGFWQARLGGKSDALGRTLRLDGEDYEVIGVLAEQFHFTMFGRANVFVPLAAPLEEQRRRNAQTLMMVGRLRTGVTLDRAREELFTLGRRLGAAYPDTNAHIGFSFVPLADEIGKHTGNAIIAIIFAVAIGLTLIACANVGNLLLARAVNRSKQAAIQLSLGATTSQLLRQGLAESMVLFTAAGLLAAAVGAWGTDIVASFIPLENRGFLPNFGVVHFELRGFAFVVGLALTLGLLFGLLPALRWARPRINVTLRETGSAASASRSSHRTQSMLVVGQVVLATVAVTATGMLVESARRQWAAPPGFDLDNLVTAYVSLNEKTYADPARRRQFWRQVESRLEPRRGMIAQTVPFGDDQRWAAFRVSGVTTPDASLPMARISLVSTSYLQGMRIPLISGRGFERADEERAVMSAIINRSCARLHFPNRNPISERITFPRWQGRTAEIVGVVEDIRHGVDSKPNEAAVYVPLQQTPPDYALIVVRAADTENAVREIRAAVAQVDADQPVYHVKTLDQRKAEQDAGFRLMSHLLSGFGGLTLLLAAIGIYSVVSYSVSRRTREFGIRSALGADQGTLLRLVWSQGWRLFLIGFIPGMALSIAAVPALRSIVSDYLNELRLLSAGPFVFAIAVVLATWLPARRAATVDPAVALRTD